MSLRVQLCVALLLFIAFTAKIWVRLETTDYGYQLGKERQKTVMLDMERRELTLQLSVLSKNDNIRQEAQKRLQFSQLTPDQVWKILE